MAVSFKRMIQTPGPMGVVIAVVFYFLVSIPRFLPAYLKSLISPFNAFAYENT